MLTPEYLAGVAEQLQDIYSQLQTRILQDIARRISKADLSVTDMAKWQIQKLQELGESQKEIRSVIAKTLNLSDKEIKTLFKTAGIKSIKTDIELQKAAIAAGKLPADTVPLTASPAFAQLMNANAKRTMNTLKKLTGSMVKDASGKLNGYLDMAQLMVQSGAFTQEQAVAEAVRKLAAQGVTQFDYATGARISVEAGVRRAVLTGVNQATAEVSLNNAAELETDLVEVTSHADARPEHAAWQGGIYSLSGKHPKYRGLQEATGYGTGAGLCGWNCRHSFYAYIEGVSEKVPKEDYDPDTYEAEQIQRYYERKIREWKRRSATLEAGGIDNTKELLKVREWQARQRAHVKKHGLARLYDREKIYTGSVAKGTGKNIIKNIEIPADFVEKTGLTADIIEACNTAIGNIESEYTLKLDEVRAMLLDNNTPFQYQTDNTPGVLRSVLAINTAYNFGNMEDFTKRILKQYEIGDMAAKTIEDLIYHELAHVLTYQGKFPNQLGVFDSELNEAFLKGISGYADKTRLGAECIAETFVRVRNGEPISEEAMQLLLDYIEKWRK